MSDREAIGSIDALVETVERLWPDATTVNVISRHSAPRSTANRHRELAIVPDAASARLLIPAGRRGAARAMLRFSASLRPREVVQRIGVAAGLRVIGTGMLPDRIQILGGSGDDIESRLAAVLGHPVTVSLGIGPARANRKPVLGVFDARGRPAAFVKVGDSRVATGHVTGEAANLRAIASVRMPNVMVPRILHEEDWHGMHLLVMSALPTRALTGGIDLSHPPFDVIDDVFTAFDEGRTPLGETPIWKQMIRAADEIGDEALRTTYRAAFERVLDDLGSEVVPVGAWHGDFAPWNLSRVRDRISVWDWERFTTGSPPGLDLAHWVVNIHTREAGFEPSIVRECMAIAAGIGDPRHWLGRVSSETYLASLSLRYLLAAQDEGGDVLAGRALAALRAFADDEPSITHASPRSTTTSSSPPSTSRSTPVPSVRRLTRLAQDRLPDSVSDSARKVATGWGRLTAGIRLEPTFIVVGAQRCGTTTLYRMLSEHPQVVRPTTSKGIGYFDLEYPRGFNWYRGHFPVEALAKRRTAPARPVTFESSGYYCYHPMAAPRMARDLPGVKAVMLVRDPVERAWSAYKHESGRGFETESFERALELEPVRLAGEEERLAADPAYRGEHHRHHSYLTRGHYADQLERLQGALGTENVFVMDAGRLFLDPGTEFTALTDWLGLSRFVPEEVEQWNARPGDLDPDLRLELAEHFEPYDTRLAEMVGWVPSWRTPVD